MCYTFNASLWSFVTSTIFSVILMRFNVVLGGFFLFVGLMQLYDLIFWSHLSKNNINFISTKMAMISNNFQPVVLGLLLILTKVKLNKFTLILFVIYLITSIIYSIYSWNKISYTLISPSSSPSLYWEWNNLPGSPYYYSFYLIITILLLYDGFTWPLNYILIGIMSVSFIFSYYNFKKEFSTGRFWCYFTGFIPALIIIVLIILKNYIL